MRSATARPGAPRARTEDLVVRRVAGETLVYDLRTHRAHCLNQPAALVWEACDGKTPVADIAARVRARLGPVDEDVVWIALRRLQRARLLDAPVSLPPARPRRDVLKRAAAAALLPAITSILAPTAAQAATCVPNLPGCRGLGQACSKNSDCCECCCSQGGTCKPLVGACRPN